MTVVEAVPKLPPSPHALDWFVAGMAQGLEIDDALAFAWDQYRALEQQRPAFIRGNR